LFTPERSRTEVRFLSGGERNRILLAKLFAKPANLIVMDEPTNDLDAETLELLEERLVAFEGTVLLVSHDRAFLNNVVTSTMVFESGGIHEYDGGFDDWIRQRADSNGAVSRAGDQDKSKQQILNDDRGTSIDSSRQSSKRQAAQLKFRSSKVIGCQSHRAVEARWVNSMPVGGTDFYQQSGDLIGKQQSELNTRKTQCGVPAMGELDRLDA
jgi:ATP-binding cassette subfamily F protein uup